MSPRVAEAERRHRLEQEAQAEEERRGLRQKLEDSVRAQSRPNGPGNAPRVVPAQQTRTTRDTSTNRPHKWG